MKNRFTLMFVLFMLLGIYSNAQTSANWQPLWLSSTNMFKGVEGFYQVTECNGDKVVLIKIVNHNNFSIRAGWKDMIATIDGQSHSYRNSTDSLTIAANSTVQGNCDNTTPQLSAKIVDFGMDAATFKSFMAAGFDFVQLHQ